ncbi:Scr1 family TA system antitoxin-like transcriptional regulator [Streptomyces sp. LE64]|uniref:Scr1 family TA system antitoxin-like transcriptional regulator n=1 Tax=Streptomyces sp. LE64 TaxID=3448653 RepID=UPI00404380EF
MTVEKVEPDPTTSLLAFFGAEVLRLRTERGMSQATLAAKALATQAMISYVERAKRVPSRELAEGLDHALRTGGHFVRLYPLVIRYAYPSWFLPYLEFEREAVSLRSFQSQVVPGLLQTEGYARAVLNAFRPDNLEDLVAARMSRQTVFERADPPQAWFVVDEYALIRHIGGRDVMRAQLERLLNVGESPRTVIQVIPKEKPEHPGLAGPFTVFGFDEGADVLFVDGFSQGRAATDPAEVTVAARAYDLLRAVALPPDESADLIGRHLKGLSA